MCWYESQQDSTTTNVDFAAVLNFFFDLVSVYFQFGCKVGRPLALEVCFLSPDISKCKFLLSHCFLCNCGWCSYFGLLLSDQRGYFDASEARRARCSAGCCRGNLNFVHIVRFLLTLLRWSSRTVKGMYFILSHKCLFRVVQRIIVLIW